MSLEVLEEVITRVSIPIARLFRYDPRRMPTGIFSNVGVYLGPMTSEEQYKRYLTALKQNGALMLHTPFAININICLIKMDDEETMKCPQALDLDYLDPERVITAEEYLSTRYVIERYARLAPDSEPAKYQRRLDVVVLDCRWYKDCLKLGRFIGEEENYGGREIKGIYSSKPPAGTPRPAPPLPSVSANSTPSPRVQTTATASCVATPRLISLSVQDQTTVTLPPLSTVAPPPASRYYQPRPRRSSVADNTTMLMAVYLAEQSRQQRVMERVSKEHEQWQRNRAAIDPRRLQHHPVPNPPAQFANSTSPLPPYPPRLPPPHMVPIHHPIAPGFAHHGSPSASYMAPRSVTHPSMIVERTPQLHGQINNLGSGASIENLHAAPPPPPHPPYHPISPPPSVESPPRETTTNSLPDIAQPEAAIEPPYTLSPPFVSITAALPETVTSPTSSDSSSNSSPQLMQREPADPSVVAAPTTSLPSCLPQKRPRSPSTPFRPQTPQPIDRWTPSRDAAGTPCRPSDPAASRGRSRSPSYQNMGQSGAVSARTNGSCSTFELSSSSSESHHSEFADKAIQHSEAAPIEHTPAAPSPERDIVDLTPPAASWPLPSPPMQPTATEAPVPPSAADQTASSQPEPPNLPAMTNQPQVQVSSADVDMIAPETVKTPAPAARINSESTTRPHILLPRREVKPSTTPSKRSPGLPTVGIFTLLGMPLSFHILCEDAGYAKMLETFIEMGGGVLASIQSAIFVVIPTPPGASMPEYAAPTCATLGAARTAISFEWVHDCVKQGTLLGIDPYRLH